MITYDRDKCMRCGNCFDVCPQLTIDWGSDGYPVQPRPHDCMECGACAKNCPAAAIRVAAGVGCFSALLRETLLGGEAGCG
jgi:NAD-dependent dihydropyrimidine dehydrogenase PreA subunit